MELFNVRKSRVVETIDLGDMAKDWQYFEIVWTITIFINTIQKLTSSDFSNERRSESKSAALKTNPINLGQNNNCIVFSPNKVS